MKSHQTHTQHQAYELAWEIASNQIIQRVRSDMIETLKILNGLEGIEKSKLLKTNPHQTERGRGHSYKLYEPARGSTAEVVFSQAVWFWNGTNSQQEWSNQRQQTSLKGNLTKSGKNLDMGL